MARMHVCAGAHSHVAVGEGGDSDCCVLAFFAEPGAGPAVSKLQQFSFLQSSPTTPRTVLGL